MTLQLNDVLQIGKRYHNNKRPYLLINPLQAKHIPVSPTVALGMMERLGRQVCEKAGPGRALVVAFAETATAIGAEVARCLGPDTLFIQTTREILPGEQALEFEEEHSHAVEQRLYLPPTTGWLEGVETLVFVDDELTSGKTMLNILNVLKRRYPLACKRLLAASVINRMDAAELGRFGEAGLEPVCLFHIHKEDYSAQIEGVEGSGNCFYDETEAGRSVEQPPVAPVGGRVEPRLCGPIEGYRRACEDLYAAARQGIATNGSGPILLLGTEECMYPALVAGAMLEREGYTVRCHATTRSPILVSEAAGYPVYNGSVLRSLYQPDRTTYVYDMAGYARVVVITDAEHPAAPGLETLTAALRRYGNKDIRFLAWRGQP